MRVIIESPYKPTVEQVAKRGEDRGMLDRDALASLMRENIAYARLLMLKALREGHAPFASHLLYTQVRSEDPEFRKKGIAAGLEWHGDESWFGVDLGMSDGMQAAKTKTRSPKLVRLFPGREVPEIREHLASLRWECFVGLPC